MKDQELIPIEIRPGYYIRIQGIPHDLTAQEACRITGVIMAFALHKQSDMPDQLEKV